MHVSLCLSVLPPMHRDLVHCGCSKDTDRDMHGCAVAFNMCTESKEAELKDWAIGLVNILYKFSW